jgi:hypothetical protein
MSQTLLWLCATATAAVAANTTASLAANTTATSFAHAKGDFILRAVITTPPNSTVRVVFSAPHDPAAAPPDPLAPPRTVYWEWSASAVAPAAAGGAAAAAAADAAAVVALRLVREDLAEPTASTLLKADDLDLGAAGLTAAQRAGEARYDIALMRRGTFFLLYVLGGEVPLAGPPSPGPPPLATAAAAAAAARGVRTLSGSQPVAYVEHPFFDIDCAAFRVAGSEPPAVAAGVEASGGATLAAPGVALELTRFESAPLPASPALQACGKRPGGCANSSWCYNQVLPGALLVLNGTFYL